MSATNVRPLRGRVFYDVFFYKHATPTEFEKSKRFFLQTYDPYGVGEGQTFFSTDIRPLRGRRRANVFFYKHKIPTGFFSTDIKLLRSLCRMLFQ